MRKVRQSVGKCWMLFPLSHILDILYITIYPITLIWKPNQDTSTPRITLCVRNFTCVPLLSRSSFSQHTSVMFRGCALWVNYRKTTFHQFIVAYNNSYRILNILPMICSASGMFATDNVNSCTCVIRKSIYSLTTRIFTSTNPIVKTIVGGDVYCTSALGNLWISLLYTIQLWHCTAIPCICIIIILLYGHIVHVCICNVWNKLLLLLLNDVIFA